MKERNTTFTILSAIGMILILLGHLDFDVATFGGLFPYYSYHVMIFVFIAGYFRKPENEEHIAGFICKKAKRLLLPYLIWNVVYGLVSAALRANDYDYAGEFNLYNIFAAPFVGGHQFGLNSPAWFVPALFLLEVSDICARKVIDFLYKRICGFRSDSNNKGMYATAMEWVVMILYLMVGMSVVYLAERGSVYDLYRIPARLMLMAPSLQFGRLYRTRLERYDITPGIIYFPLLFLMNLILTTTHGGLAYSTVWVTGFGGTLLTPFITSLTGIALWLRISKILCKLFDNKETPSFRIVGEGEELKSISPAFRLMQGIGTHTYDIMMHHLAVFWLIKAAFVRIGESTAFATVLNDIDIQSFKSDIYYTYVPDGIIGYKWVYLAAGLLIPLMVGYLSEAAISALRTGISNIRAGKKETE